MAAISLDHVDQKAGPVLERAAVLVLSVVDRGAEELGEKISMRSVQFDAVQTGFTDPARGLCKIPDQLTNLLHCHGLAQKSVEGVVLAGGGKGWLHEVLHSRHVALPAGVAKLDQEFAVVPVDRFAHLAPERDLIVVVHHGVVRQDAAADMDGAKGRNDGAHAATRKAFLPVDSRLAPRPVVIVPPAGYVRSKKTVLHREISEF
jgi:hypothetical protein